MTRLRSDLADVGGALTARRDAHRAELEQLVRIPSVSAQGFDPAEVRRSATAVASLLERTGLEGVRLLEIEGAHPAVYGEWTGAGRQAPTVLLYAHHDVQPPGDAAAWSSPPFVPTERNGRLYGRGSADDKAGILVHVAAVDAWLRATGRLPVNVKLIIEGEEETGSEHLGDFLARYQDTLRSDVMVLTDSANWQVGVPAITTSLRGLVDCVVEVAALDHALHSGMYGGPVPDPLTALAKLLAGLTDEHGVVTVPGLADDAEEISPDQRAELDALDFDEARLREEAGLLDGVPFAGDPDRHPLERVWHRPNLTVVGVDAPAVAVAGNTLVPRARAKLSLRLAPGQDPERARSVLCDHLRSQRPLGLPVRVTPGAAARGFRADRSHPAFGAAARALTAAYGCEVVHIGLGGTIPFIAPFAAAFGGVPALLTGVEDPDTRAHGVDESLHLDDWVRACRGEALLLDELLETSS